MQRLGVKMAMAGALLLAWPVMAASHRDVMVDAPLAVTQLQAAGLDVGTVVFAQPARNNADLQQSPAWRSVVKRVADALQSRKKADRKLGVGIRFSHRLFDVRWLTARQAHWQLIAVANRIDRAPFAAEGCGETRLIYRLGYDVGADASFLPMTLNVVFRQPGTCFEAWKRWPWDGNREPRQLLQPQMALAPTLLSAENLLSVELNLQSVRWPSTVKPDLGGHAEYLLLVLHRSKDGTFAPAPMENQPDVARMKREPALRAGLLAWLREPTHLAAIDAGTAVVPPEFQAQTATSVAPRGLARLQNRPFRQLFSPRDLADVDLRAYPQMPTPTALLRRLDAMSCTGCHQSNSLAGFHLLGTEPANRKLDALAVGRSAHLGHEIVARQVDMDTWPEMPKTRRLDEADLLDVGMPNGPCGLEETTGLPGCADLPTAKLRCVQVDDAEVGMCLPEAGDIGAVCEAGEMHAGKIAEQDALRHVTALTCPLASVCNSSRAGFPAGVCVGWCANPPDGTTCTGIPQLTPFNRCLAQHKPFTECVTSTAVAVLVRACSEETPCRADFVCSRGPQGQGACMPPYFLRQLRVDGHPPVQ
jgi:hypothetical protein